MIFRLQCDCAGCDPDRWRFHALSFLSRATRFRRAVERHLGGERTQLRPSFRFPGHPRERPGGAEGRPGALHPRIVHRSHPPGSSQRCNAGYGRQGLVSQRRSGRCGRAVQLPTQLRRYVVRGLRPGLLPRPDGSVRRLLRPLPVPRPQRHLRPHQRSVPQLPAQHRRRALPAVSVGLPW